MCQSSAWNCVTAICPRLAASLSRHRPCIILFERIIIAVIRTYVPVNPFTVTAVDCSTRWITKDDWCRATGRSAALQRHTWKQTGERKYRAESSTPLQTPRVFLVSKNCNKYTSCIFFAQGQFDRKNCSKHLTPKGFSKEISKFQSCQELEKLQVQVHEFLDIFVTCRESRVMQSSFVFSLNKRMKNKGTKLSDTLKKLHSHARVLNFSTVWKLCAKI